MRVRAVITGTKPLLMHNVQLANPDNTWAKQISAIAKKRKKTEEDRIELSKLEFMGSLYVHDGKIVMPAGNVQKCFINCAKITKEGKTITRALSPVDIFVPLIYTGPQTPEGLLEKSEFFDQTIVAVQGRKVVRTRPIFRGWGLEVEFELLSDVLDYESFEKIAKLAGIAEGLGDNRSNGYGRFEVDISQVEQKEIRRAA